jgi:alkylated DNA nucleotide flippase Atl1
VTCRLKKLASVTAIALTLAGSAQSDAQIGPKVRRVRWSSEIPLERVVRPDDEIVIVEKPAQHHEPFMEEPDAERELLFRAEQVDDLFVADVTSVSPTVTDNGTWLKTTITARVVQILKHNPKFPNKRPSVWRIVHDGGQISLRDVTIKAGMYPVVRRGRRYLMFTAHNTDNGATQAGPAFEIDRSGRLVTSETSLDGPLPSVLNGMKLSDVSRLLKEK